MKLSNVLALGLSLGMTCSAFAPPPPKPAAEKKKEMPTFLTVEEAGPDYKIQGEYGAAEAGKAKFGVQVIALADDKFRAVVYPGGLPGAGWSGDKATKVEIDGKRLGDKVAFEGKDWKGEIGADGSAIKLTGQ